MLPATAKNRPAGKDGKHLRFHQVPCMKDQVGSSEQGSGDLFEKPVGASQMSVGNHTDFHMGALNFVLYRG
jgi:hypothetical protein